MGLSNFRAPELTPEQQRADELKARGLRRSSWDGRDEPIPVSIVPADFVKALDRQIAAGTLTYEGKSRALHIETQRLYAVQLEEGRQRMDAQAAANTAAREAQEAAQRAELHNLWAESEAQKAAAWTRYQTLAGRALGGGMLADRRLFEETWQKHLAQRAILESAGPVDG